MTIELKLSAEQISQFSGKRIAVTGPSAHVIGTNQGPAIEQFDLVTRINFQWPIPDNLKPDLGSRMDILFHCCNGDHPINLLYQPEFEKTKFVFWEEGEASHDLRSKCSSLGIPSIEVTDVYLRIREIIGSHPNTGTVAITSLLALPIAELYVTGITCFKSKYYQGYRADGANPENWSEGVPKKIWEHEFDPQIQYLKHLLAIDPRFKPDQFFRTVLEQP